MWRNRNMMKGSRRMVEICVAGFIPVRYCSSSSATASASAPSSGSTDAEVGDGKQLQTTNIAPESDLVGPQPVPASELAGKAAGGYDRNDPTLLPRPTKMSAMRHGAIVLPNDASLEHSSQKVNDAEIEEILDEDSFSRKVDTQDALKMRAQELIDIAMTRHPPKDYAYWDRHGPNKDIHIPEEYELCGARPDMRLEDIKIKFLLQCRQHHPEIGGNPVHYIRVCEAFEKIMAEHGVVMQADQAANFGAKHQRYLSENYELNKVLLTHDLKVLEKHTQENLNLLIGEAEWTESKPRPTPFRDQSMHPYNLAFRKDRDAPDEDRAVPGDDAHESMTKEEYALSLKRADRLMERGNLAGENAMVAEAAMWETREAKDMAISMTILAAMGVMITGVLLISYERALNHNDLIEERPDLASEVLKDTPLPWWGNDYDYERAVKRFFLEEYRKARNFSNREVLYNAGMGREGLDLADEQRLTLDKKIFEVSSARLAELQTKVQAVKDSRSIPRAQLEKERLPAPPLEEGEEERKKFTPRIGAELPPDTPAPARPALAKTADEAAAAAAKFTVPGVRPNSLANGEMSLAPPPDRIDTVKVF